MLNVDALAFIPVILGIVAIYAFFSIAIDVRAIRRLLERQTADRVTRTP